MNIASIKKTPDFVRRLVVFPSDVLSLTFTNNRNGVIFAFLFNIFLSKNAIEATEHLGVKCIITDTVTGKTSRNLSAFRGPNPVIALCCNDKVHRLLALSYGVIPLSQHLKLSTYEQYIAALRLLHQKEYIDLDDKVAYLSGSLGQGGGNTFLEINKVRDVLEKSFKRE